MIVTFINSLKKDSLCLWFVNKLYVYLMIAAYEVEFKKIHHLSNSVRMSSY